MLLSTIFSHQNQDGEFTHYPKIKPPSMLTNIIIILCQSDLQIGLGIGVALGVGIGMLIIIVIGEGRLNVKQKINKSVRAYVIIVIVPLHSITCVFSNTLR